MAQLTLYTAEEVAERNKPKRQRKREEKERIVGQFQEQLTNAGPGFGGQVQLDEGEDKRKTRTLLREAATRAGLVLRFRPIKAKDRIEFAVVENAPRRGRRGRPKKRT